MKQKKNEQPKQWKRSILLVFILCYALFFSYFLFTETYQQSEQVEALLNKNEANTVYSENILFFSLIETLNFITNNTGISSLQLLIFLQFFLGSLFLLLTYYCVKQDLFFFSTLVCCPAILLTLTQPIDTLIILVAITTTILLYQKRKYKESALLAILTSLLHPLSGSILALILLIEELRREKKNKTLPFLFLIPFILLIQSLRTQGIIETYPNLWNSLHPLGIMLPYVVLGILGVILSWKQRSKERLYLFITIMSLPLTKSIGLVMISYFSIFFCVEVLKRTQEKKEKASLLRQASAWICFCILVFATLSFIDIVNTENKTSPEVEEAIDFFNQKKQNTTTDILLTDESYYNTIYSRTKQQTFHAQQSYQRDIQEQLLHSRNKEETLKLLNDYNISLILITEEMYSGLTWERKEEGIHFLLENSIKKTILSSSENFTIYKIQEIQIPEIIKEESFNESTKEKNSTLISSS